MGGSHSEAVEIEDFAGRHIVVLGDIMLDRFVYGHVDRISPEAPIPVLCFDRETVMLGGAANVARNVATLGGRPTLIGVLGDDEAGDVIAERLLKSDAIEGRCLRRVGHPTTIKTRFISGGQQLMRLDVEQPLDVDAQTADALLAELGRALPDAHTLVISDYAKGVLSPAVVSGAIALARKLNVPVIVDPKNIDMSLYRGADVITPNAIEAHRASGYEISSDENAEAASQALCEQCAVGAVVLTRGARGMTIHDASTGSTVHIPTKATEVYDVSGAGDTAVATLALGIASGLGVARSAILANAAAGIVVAKLGTAAVYADELARALLDLSLDHQEEKVLTRDALVARVRRWQAEGLRVGFTNGCFDLIHPGHISVLRQARAACDRLVVALNTDESVRGLKGKARPIQVESARAIVMASIGSVDAVTLFAEDTPLALIEAVMPNVLFKGADYAVDQVVGGDFVRAQGGKVVLIPIEAGHSTTSMIARAG